MAREPLCSVCADAHTNYVCARCRADPANDGWVEESPDLLAALGPRPWESAPARRLSPKLIAAAREFATSATATVSDVAARVRCSRRTAIKAFAAVQELSAEMRARLLRPPAELDFSTAALQQAAWREWKTTVDLLGHLSEHLRAARRPPGWFVMRELGFGREGREGPSLAETLSRAGRGADAWEESVDRAPVSSAAEKVILRDALRALREEAADVS
jgi:hypothetical protein